MRRIANIRGYMVTPYAGVWIEMIVSNNDSRLFCVTPYAGVWIEIEITPYISSRSESLPTRECGLKFFQKSTIGFDHRHSLRGSVD